MSRVLVIGDIIIDKYIYGTSTRLSPEAPVPVVNKEREEITMGGAALVYENLKSLGVNVAIFETGAEHSVKTRVLCDGHYVTRIDEDHIADSSDVLDRILRTDFSAYDYVILSDYNKGTLKYSNDIISHINQFFCKVIVDPKCHVSHYDSAWLVKPNAKEFTELEFNKWSENIITTRAGNSVIARIDNNRYEVKVDTVEVSDVTGAGDCFLAAFVYALTKGYEYKKCLELAVKGSRIAVQHTGTYTLSKHDLEDRVIFTNGCFDILHTGHFKLLAEAKSLGDKLIVGLNSDASVKRLKGNDRPINNQETRLTIKIASLGR